MKKNLRFTMIVLAILALLLSTFPASAAEVIPIEGYCEIIAFPPWIGDIAQSPYYRYWFKEDGMEHWRNQAILNTCDFNDDRLDGYFYVLDSWNTNPNENSNYDAREFGKGYMSDENGNDLGLWDLVGGKSWTDSAGVWVSDQVWIGRGVYKNLSVRLTWTYVVWPIYYVEGELLVP